MKNVHIHITITVWDLIMCMVISVKYVRIAVIIPLWMIYIYIQNSFCKIYLVYFIVVITVPLVTNHTVKNFIMFFYFDFTISIIPSDVVKKNSLLLRDNYISLIISH